MRLNISADPGITNLYNVNVIIAYGDKSEFASPDDPDRMDCQGGTSAQRYCAVIRLSTSVYEGLS